MCHSWADPVLFACLILLLIPFFKQQKLFPAHVGSRILGHTEVQKRTATPPPRKSPQPKVAAKAEGKAAAKATAKAKVEVKSKGA